MMSKWPYPIVTVELLDWPSPGNVLAIPLAACSEADIDTGWSAPNQGVQSLLNHVDQYLSIAMKNDPIAWEFRGVRRNDAAEPAVLPGETFVAGGIVQVAKMFEAQRLYEALGSQDALEGVDASPQQLGWNRITNQYVGGLKDRLEALEPAVPRA